MPLALQSVPLGGTIKSPVYFPNGTAASPSISFFTASNTGIYLLSATALGISVAGQVRLTIGTTVINSTNSIGVDFIGTVANCSFQYSSSSGTGMYFSATSVNLAAVGVDAGQFDNSVTATHTRFLVYDVSKGAVSRVTVGANDSGGAGFKLLRVPN